MAGRSMARSTPQDENLLNPLLSAKNSGGGMTGKGMTQERRKLSNITNKLQPLSQAPAARGNATLSLKPLDSHNSSQPRKSVARTPLRNISNQNEIRGLSPTWTLNPKPKGGRGKQPTHLSEELEKKAEMWAEEGIERVQFTGKDMELLGEKMQQEELEKRIAVAMAYRTNFPSFLPCASEKVVEEIGDALKMDPDEEVYILEHPKIFLEVEPLDSNDIFEDIPLETNFDRKDAPLITRDWQMVRDDACCNIQRKDHGDVNCSDQLGLCQVDFCYSNNCKAVDNSPLLD